MHSVSSLMRDYFASECSQRVLSEGLPKEVPIIPKKVVWKPTQDGSSLMRTYEFENSFHLRSFLDQIISMQIRVDHHAQILIEEKTVKIRVGTKSLNRITELDTEFAAEADNIYEETRTSEV